MHHACSRHPAREHAASCPRPGVSRGLGRCAGSGRLVFLRTNDAGGYGV